MSRQQKSVLVMVMVLVGMALFLPSSGMRISWSTAAGNCPGDLDCDGDVDGGDLSTFATDFGRTDCPKGPEGPAPVSLNAAAGIVSHGELTDCIVGDVITCQQSTRALVSVPHGVGSVRFDLVIPEHTIMPYGQPVVIPEVVVQFKLSNPDPTGSGDRAIHATITDGSVSIDAVELRPDQPAQDLTPVGLVLRMQLVSDSLVAVTGPAEVEGSYWKNVTTEVDGDVTAFVRPYAADAQQAQIEAEIVNSGEITADYLVTVKECSGHIAEAVPFQIISLPPGVQYAKTLLFDLRTDTAFAAGDTCTVNLQALTGRLFHIVVVTFPAPS